MEKLARKFGGGVAWKADWWYNVFIILTVVCQKNQAESGIRLTLIIKGDSDIL